MFAICPISVALVRAQLLGSVTVITFTAMPWYPPLDKWLLGARATCMTRPLFCTICCERASLTEKAPKQNRSSYGRHDAVEARIRRKVVRICVYRRPNLKRSDSRML